MTRKGRSPSKKRTFATILTPQVMRGSRALMGSRLFSAFVRPTFYRQFVGGDTGAELKDTADRLSESGLRLMVR